MPRAEQYDRWYARLAADWGGPAGSTSLPQACGTIRYAQLVASMLRLAASPGSLRSVLDALRDSDVRALRRRCERRPLCCIGAATRPCVLQRAGACRQHRRSALCPARGGDHWFFAGDQRPVRKAIGDFSSDWVRCRSSDMRGRRSWRPPHLPLRQQTIKRCALDQLADQRIGPGEPRPCVAFRRICIERPWGWGYVPACEAPSSRMRSIRSSADSAVSPCSASAIGQIFRGPVCGEPTPAGPAAGEEPRICPSTRSIGASPDSADRRQRRHRDRAAPPGWAHWHHPYAGDHRESINLIRPRHPRRSRRVRPGANFHGDGARREALALRPRRSPAVTTCSSAAASARLTGR